jgi:acetylglutamate kinase
MLEPKIIVIKYGGSLLEDPAHSAVFLKDVTALSQKEKVVLVHGGGKEITRALEKKGIPPRFVNGLRFTDDATMQIVEEVLARLNQGVVKQLKDLNVRAEGYSGKTDHIVKGEALPELGRVGKPKQVNLAAFGNILRKLPLPVFYPVAEDAAGASLNINADDFAQALAIACQASRLVFLTDTGGVLDSNKQLIPNITSSSAEDLIQRGVITGGMIVKTRACVEALGKGVGSVDITQDIKYLLNGSSAVTHFEKN